MATEDENATEIAELEKRIGDLINKLGTLRKASVGQPVPNYTFATTDGQTTLRDLFGPRSKLLVIHNMGQGCRFCTLWADGFNGLLPHLEDALAVVLVSKDPPPVQRTFANSRGWRFRMASHGGEPYIQEQGVFGNGENYPGAVVYERDGDVILRKNVCVFGPDDLYCALWPLFGMAGLDGADWTPQYTYWIPPIVRSVRQIVRESCLFTEKPPQKNGTVCFAVRGYRGASIYVKSNDAKFEIFERALRNQRFPGNAKLEVFIRNSSPKGIRKETGKRHAFQLDGKHIAQVIEIIEEGQRKP